MTKKINQLRSTVEDNMASSKNFSELNFKETYIWPNKIARTFFKVDLNEEYWQLGSKEYPSYFYIRTESGNIYKIFKPTYETLWNLTENDTKCQQILLWPTQWCLYNPQTNTITGVQNTEIKCGDVYRYSPQCNTSEVKEIVGVSDGMWTWSPASLKSSIEKEFEKKIQ